MIKSKPMYTRKNSYLQGPRSFLTCMHGKRVKWKWQEDTCTTQRTRTKPTYPSLRTVECFSGLKKRARRRKKKKRTTHHRADNCQVTFVRGDIWSFVFFLSVIVDAEKKFQENDVRSGPDQDVFAVICILIEIQLKTIKNLFLSVVVLSVFLLGLIVLRIRVGIRVARCGRLRICRSTSSQQKMTR